ncbi:MAG: FtsX-like permease family protein [Ruminococcus sp.]|nr:FtsX-like permease family protein [Ruminococcus sp.]
MLWRILKKDLKRKKTMNIVLLLFVIMCSMFASASVSSIFAVTGGIDSYFDMADVPDLIIQCAYDSDIDEQAAKLPEVKSMKVEHHLTVLDSGCFTLNGKKFDNFTNIARLMNSSERAITYFDEDDNVLAEPAKGEFYASLIFTQDSGLNKGDTVVIRIGETELPLRFMGRFKPVVYGQSSTEYPYLMLNEEDFRKCEKDPVFKSWASKYLFIETDDTEAVADRFKDQRDSWCDTRDERKDIYLYDMIAAYLMMVISIVLMAAGFVMMRYTIGFTISEEFREIGVMKAVGISNGRIRRLYITKYLAISVIGAVAGFFLSIPLSSSMLENISMNIVFDKGSSMINGLISSVAIVVLMMLFCYFCTRRIKKLSPIDAVRCGQTGERFGKKSILHLGRSKLPTTGFMALNDVLSAPRQFIIITLVFALCILLVTSISVFSRTLKSNNIVNYFGIPDSDITVGDITSLEDVFAGKGMKKTVEKYNKLFREKNIPAEASISIGAQYETVKDGKKAMITYLITAGGDDDGYITDEGCNATKPDEVVMTRRAMELIGAGIGDRVKMTIGGVERELMITGSFSSFMGGGKTARICSQYEHDADKIDNTFGLQVKLIGDRSDEAAEKYIAELKMLFGSEKVFSNRETVEKITGLSSTMESMKQMMMILTAIVTALTVVLTERSFISKEKSEIALMKAVGISDGKIILQHILRFVIISVLAGAIASAAMLPLSSAVLDWIFSMIGDITGVTADYNAAEVFVLHPMIVAVTSVVCSALTALYMKTIKSSDTASIE